MLVVDNKWMIKYHELCNKYLFKVFIHNRTLDTVTVEDVLFCMDDIIDIAPITFRLSVRHTMPQVFIPFKESMALSTFENDYSLVDSTLTIIKKELKRSEEDEDKKS